MTKCTLLNLKPVRLIAPLYVHYGNLTDTGTMDYCNCCLYYGSFLIKRITLPITYSKEVVLNDTMQNGQNSSQILRHHLDQVYSSF
jgi:hypothetical protein